LVANNRSRTGLSWILKAWVFWFLVQVEFSQFPNCPKILFLLILKNHLQTFTKFQSKFLIHSFQWGLNSKHHILDYDLWNLNHMSAKMDNNYPFKLTLTLLFYWLFSRFVLSNVFDKNETYELKGTDRLDRDSWVSFLRRTGVNFTNILRAAFTSSDTKSAEKTVKSSVFFFTVGICMCKSCL